MISKIERSWIAVMTSLFFLTLGIAGSASAEDIMIVDTVDTLNSTITIEGDTYMVTVSSRLLDGEGNRIRLASVNDTSGPMGPDQVRITTRGSSGEIATLEVVPMLLP